MTTTILLPSLIGTILIQVFLHVCSNTSRIPPPHSRILIPVILFQWLIIHTLVISRPLLVIPRLSLSIIELRDVLIGCPLTWRHTVRLETACSIIMSCSQFTFSGDSVVNDTLVPGVWDTIRIELIPLLSSELIL